MTDHPATRTSTDTTDTRTDLDAPVTQASGRAVPDPENPRWAEGQPQQPQEQGAQPALQGDQPRPSHEKAAEQVSTDSTAAGQA